jgi:hypothetical protein
MTFWPAYKAMRSIAAGQNVAEKNRAKGVSPTAVFRSPSRLLAAKHIQSCYAQFLLYSKIYFLNILHFI